LESIGSLTKTKRTERGLTLAEAHEATKITMQNLAAIEEDRFDAFPNRVYARAFLRDYANYLGLDSNDLLQRYEQEWGTPVAPPPPTRKGFRAVAISFAVVVILGVVAAGGYLYINYMPRPKPAVKPAEPPIASRPTPKPTPAPVTATTTGTATHTSSAAPMRPAPAMATGTAVAHPGPSHVATTTTATTTASTAAVKPVPAPVPPATSGLLIGLRAARGDSWITIKVDGKQVASKNLTAGQQVSFPAKQRVSVHLGNAGRVDVTVNGKSVGTIGGNGQVITKVFTKQ
jgi:cytoskeleton protein RodZ